MPGKAREDGPSAWARVAHIGYCEGAQAPHFNLALVYCWQECKMVQLLWKKAASSLKYSTKLLQIPPGARKTRTHMKICTWTFTESFLTASKYQQPRCPNNMHKHIIHKMQCYLPIKNKIVIQAALLWKLSERRNNGDSIHTFRITEKVMSDEVYMARTSPESHLVSRRF